MDRKLITLALVTLVGIGVTYGEGLLLARGVATWSELLLLAGGGMIGIAVALIAGTGLLRELYRRG